MITSDPSLHHLRLQSSTGEIAPQNDPINRALQTYLKGWGPVAWRDDVARANPPQNLELARALYAASVVETETMAVQIKLRLSKLDRRAAIREFNLVWQAEESEHGRALRALADLVAGEPVEWPVRKRSIRSALSAPGLLMARLAYDTMEASYLTLGAAAEYIAISTYRVCAPLVRDRHASKVLLAIAAQEGRHLHFYRNTAGACLSDPGTARSVARLMSRLWRPPGMDALGETEWIAAFRPLFELPSYRRRMLGMDNFLSKLLAPSNVRVMNSFVTKHDL